MSVFTPLTHDQLTEVLAAHGLRLAQATPISEGIENSNYRIDAVDSAGRPLALVLTLFEQLEAEQLPWFCEALSQLAATGLPVPEPRAGRIVQCRGRPTVLVPRLPGTHLQWPDDAALEQIGAALARIHLSPLPASPCPAPPPQAQLQLLFLHHADALSADDQAQAASLMQRWQALDSPPVLCHGDLFRDNVLFDHGQLSGLLDFYNAGPGCPLYDLAITQNDWCRAADNQLAAERDAILLAGYTAVRPLSAEQLALLPLARTVAALRFWLSRLAQPHSAEGTLGQGHKDPQEFEQIYRQRLAALG
ncbi:homoserine kinase [Isoalcanivorax beigongshangi]|uniref:Homoserine kinase n=1 Tax=Isoalcanivorax beigongshangi TaxID=3238810 RepID=A0ABV4ADH3_9GAMM